MLIIGNVSSLDEVKEIEMIYKIFVVGLRFRELGKNENKDTN